jgi:hypothetical protein
MKTLKNNIKFTALAENVKIDDELLTVTLVDGRIISVPTGYFGKLFNATQEARENFEIIGDGEGIHWISLDEDILIETLLRIE